MLVKRTREDRPDAVERQATRFWAVVDDMVAELGWSAVMEQLAKARAEDEAAKRDET